MRVSLRLWSGLGLLVFVGACGGAASVEFFGEKPASGDAGPDPSGTVTSSPTGTTTTDPTAEPDAALPPPTGACSSDRPNCPQGQICAIKGCSGSGACVDASTFGNDPVCGCDKLTYATAELVRNVGVRGAGACAGDDAIACNGSCSGNAKCNVPVSGALACNEGKGTCWRMPQSCPASLPKAYRFCGSVTCGSACEAVLQGRRYFADPLCR